MLDGKAPGLHLIKLLYLSHSSFNCTKHIKLFDLTIRSERLYHCNLLLMKLNFYYSILEWL